MQASLEGATAAATVLRVFNMQLPTRDHSYRHNTSIRLLQKWLNTQGHAIRGTNAITASFQALTQLAQVRSILCLLCRTRPLREPSASPPRTDRKRKPEVGIRPLSRSACLRTHL